MADMPFRLIAASVTRPADVNAYASGDLVANSVTAGSVTPLSWDVHRSPNGSFRINRIKIKKSGAVITNASFRLHLYSSAPTVANGDNGAWSSSESGYLGFVDVVVDKAFTDGSAGHGAPVYTNVLQLLIKLAGVNDTTTSKKIYGLLEARAAYTPASAEVITVYLETAPE